MHNKKNQAAAIRERSNAPRGIDVHWKPCCGWNPINLCPVRQPRVSCQPHQTNLHGKNKLETSEASLRCAHMHFMEPAALSSFRKITHLSTAERVAFLGENIYTQIASGALSAAERAALERKRAWISRMDLMSTSGAFIVWPWVCAGARGSHAPPSHSRRKGSFSSRSVAVVPRLWEEASTKSPPK